MQTYQRQNFLQVSFDPIRGLKLNWNFKDLGALEHYFRHIFVIFSQKSKDALNILEFLHTKMKSGDLFCCIYAHDTYIYKVGNWVEKSQLSSFRTQRYLKQMSNRSLDKNIKGKLIEGARRQASEFDEPVVINFIGVQITEVDYYKSEILRHRISSNKGYQYIVNLFGNFEQNTISVHSGINQFKADVANFSNYAEYYHKIINSATVQTAKLQLTAINGQLSVFNEADWRDIDFNKIGTTYYGPSSSYDFDNLYFYNKEQSFNVQHEFQLKLQIKLFNSKILESLKRIKINFYNEKEYNLTFYNNRLNPFFVQKDICLSQNPYKCEIFIKYKQQKDQKGKLAAIQV